MMKIILVLLVCTLSGTYSATSDPTCEQCQQHVHILRLESDNFEMLMQMIGTGESAEEVCQLFNLCDDLNSKQTKEFDDFVIFNHKRHRFWHAVKKVGVRAGKAALCAACKCC